jgi:hypothetical protein
LQEYQHLLDKFGDRPNPTASRFAAILFTIENQFLTLFVNSLAEDTFLVSTYMFDGAIIHVLKDDGETKMNDAINAFNEHSEIQIAIKEWPSV